MKKLNYYITSLAVSAMFSGCQKAEKEDVSQTPQPKQEVPIPKPTAEAKFNGQFTFDLTMDDKSSRSKNGRAYLTKKAVVDKLDLSLTFYGNGKGVDFIDNGDNQYMTKKMLDSRQFEYKVQNDTLMLKTVDDKQLKPFAIILDEAINKDYFEVHIIGTNFPLGLYKVGDSPKTN